MSWEIIIVIVTIVGLFYKLYRDKINEIKEIENRFTKIEKKITIIEEKLKNITIYHKVIDNMIQTNSSQDFEINTNKINRNKKT